MAQQPGPSNDKHQQRASTSQPTFNLSLSLPATAADDPEPTDYSRLYQESPSRDVDMAKVYRMMEGSPIDLSRSPEMTDLDPADDNPKAKSTSTPSETTTCDLLAVKMVIEDMDRDKRRGWRQRQESGDEDWPQGCWSPSARDGVIETPLMFSRSSSMQSLASCDVKSTAGGVEGTDDGSVVSEFSRLPSELVSPSDLPSSPLRSPNKGLASGRSSGDRNRDEEEENALLDDCIKSGMPNGTNYQKSELWLKTTSSSPSSKRLITPKPTPNLTPDQEVVEFLVNESQPEERANSSESDNEDEHDEEEQLLQQCILLGMSRG